MSEWYSLYKGGTGEIEEKKSRFIANIYPVTTPEEASEYINKIKKQYWDARHNCSAYVIGDEGQNMRSSDDGEPSGTAGRPMLEVLVGEKITNVCVVVTRYFGGTLLGTGGLVRAYQGAVKEGLKACSVLKKIPGRRVKALCDYTDFGKLQFICTQNGYYIENTDYSDNVEMSIIASEDELEILNQDFRDATSGRVTINDDEKVIFAIIDGKPEIMD